MSKTIKVVVVSPQMEVYSGEAKMVYLKGQDGDLGIAPGHLQLLTSIAPGPVRLEKADGEEELLYVSGGIVEVQPHQVSILADVIERPQDVNEAQATEAATAAKKILAGKEKGIDQQKAQQDLAQAMARLRVLELMRKKHKGH